jgi:galactofuranosylgalactofuranosylrhamnosyl-N-acetylglucosaminyl-diphospho-decaprenol beta-1,5/1,6-galactofuranosyltransferase
VLAKLDSALVSSAEGTNAVWLRRDRHQFRTLGLRGLKLHRRLRKRWSALAADYRAAAPDFNSPTRWRQTFADSVKPAATGDESRAD